MSILKKLFGRKTESGISRRKDPRVKVSPLHNVKFEEQGSTYQLNCISKGGIGLIRPPNPKDVEGQKKSGKLILNSHEHLIPYQVRHQTGQVAGCQFESPSAELIRDIEEYFRVEILGLRLRAINPSFLKEDPRGTVMWYTDGRANEVFVVVDKGGLVDFHLSFLGNYLEGGRGKAVKGGMLIEEPTEKAAHKGSQVLQLGEVDADMRDVAKLFVNHLEAMPEEVRELLQLSVNQ